MTITTLNQNQAFPKTAVPSRPTEDEADIDIRSLMLMLWRRKLVIVGMMLIGISLTVVILGLIQPRYSARSLVLIEDKGGAKLAPELQNILSYVRVDNTLVSNEIEVIRSRNMGVKVIEKLNLLTDREFNPYYRDTAKAENGTEQQIDDNSRFKTLSLNDDNIKSVPPSVTQEQVSHAVTRLLSMLKVRSVPGSNAVEIEFQSTSPAKAALIANAVADLYIEQRLETKFKTARKLSEWLDKRLTELRNQVRLSETAVQKYKEQHNIIEGTRAIVSEEQLSQLNAELVKTKAEYAEAQARFEEIQALAKSGGRLDASAEVLNSPLIQKLKGDETALQRALSDLSSRYGDKHPDILKMKVELDDLRTKIGQEMGTIMESVRNEVSVAKARVDALQAGIDEIVQNRHHEDEAMIQLGELEREAQSNKLIFDTFLQTYKKSDEQEDLQEPEARVLSYAVAPTRASYPDKMLLLSLASALSLFLGLGLAFLLEKLDNTFRSAGQLERTGHFPCFALIPVVDSLKGSVTADFVLSKPSSTAAESVRTLRTVINLRHSGELRPKVVTMTSSLPGEGKSTLAGWLARLAAKSGEKVILIDADLRRPQVHRSFGFSNDVSLVEYLTGKKELKDIIQKDDASGLHVIAGKSVPNSALDLIASQKMSDLVAALREVYDLVIIDSPACLAVSDARVLARLSDQTLYAVSWDRTPREIVLGGIKQFSDMGYNNLAFVLTNVDVQKHVRYGYGDTVYYYGRYKEDES
ncbi:MAG: polysaccharide biosynthesis tyrosine autokinase [Alphaproteobacteria bacterium]|nr:polysaccharide biosynthesis tyrosine autokinase [Alphaproteobacteria bacterium]